MATQISVAYGPRKAKLFFDGDVSKYELWGVKFLGCLRIQHLHQIILSPTDQSDDMDFVEKNATVFPKLIQYLDDKSLSLVIRGNGRKALIILREHYLSKTGSLAQCVECSPMIRETWVQSQVASYQRL